jgi:hypothetical protein
MRRELLSGVTGRRRPLKGHHRVIMMCLGFLLIVTGVCIHLAMYFNHRYLLFGLVLIPSLLIAATGASLVRGAVTYPSAETNAGPTASSR